jgi:putative serine protease PepD
MVDTTHAAGPDGSEAGDPSDGELPTPWTPVTGETLSLEITPIGSAATDSGRVESPPLPRRPRRWWRVAGLIAVSALSGALAATAITLWLGDDETPTATTVAGERVDTRIITSATPESTAAAVAEKVLPSIVTVEVDLTGGADFVTDASGSGVVLDPDGDMVTNDHVVAGGVKVRVVFSNGRIYPADVVGTDPLTDLAVIHIDATGLIPIELGSSTDLSIGDPAIAIGSPLGLEGGPSVTVGVLSAFDRRVQTDASTELFGMLQTDAPITRGSSGGALVDAHGRLIGITSAIGVSDVGAEGLGFAIPVELVGRVTGELIDTGTVHHAFLGITGITHFESLDDGALAPAGVEIGSVLDDTAAAAAGLQQGDVIVSVDGHPVTTMDQLVVLLRFHHVGDDVPVHVRRAGEELDLEVILMERPEGM